MNTTEILTRIEAYLKSNVEIFENVKDELKAAKFIWNLLNTHEISTSNLDENDNKEEVLEFVTIWLDYWLDVHEEKAERRPKLKKVDNSKPGVIATIFDIIADHDGVRKDEILEQLRSVFPDRDPSKMKATINAQLTGKVSRLEKSRNVEFLKEKVDGKIVYSLKN